MKSVEQWRCIALDTEKLSRIFYIFGIVFFGIILLYLGVARLLIYFLPFLIAALIAVLIEPLVIMVQKGLRIPRSVSSFIVLFCVLVIAGIIIGYGGYQAVKELILFSQSVGQYSSSVYNAVMEWIYNLQEDIKALPPVQASAVQNAIDQAVSYLSNFLQYIIDALMGVANFLPALFWGTLVCIVSAFFMSMDKDVILGFIIKQVPARIVESTGYIKTDLFNTVFGFLRAQLIIMTVTFLEISFGFMIMGYSYPFLIGLSVAIVDILPVLGSGSVLIPWSIILMVFYRNFPLAIYILILYGIVVVVRQMLEPRVVGRSIGLHPLVTLMAMYVGTQIMGFIGIILGPVILIAIKTFQKAGIIPKFKE